MQISLCKSGSHTPSQRVLESDLPAAELEVVDQHQVGVIVAVDSVVGAQSLHGESRRRVTQEFAHFCHCHAAASQRAHRATLVLGHLQL